jgi:5-methylcytosine-specific restriction endonuclease McrA
METLGAVLTEHPLPQARLDHTIDRDHPTRSPCNLSRHITFTRGEIDAAPFPIPDRGGIRDTLGGRWS